MSDITSKIIDFSLELICLQANAALDAAPDYFTALADKTTFPEERTIYLDAMHDLSFARKKVYGAFRSELEDAFSVFKTNEVPDKYQSHGGVISNFSGAKDMEERLALETMLNKSKANAEVALVNVVRSVDAMMGSDWSKRHINPFDPQYIIRAWVAATAQMRMDAKGNLAMYGILDRQLLALLPEIYEKAGGFLESLATKRSSRPGRSDDAEQENVDADDLESMFGDIDSATPTGGFNTSNEDMDDDSPADELNTDLLIRTLEKLQQNRDLDDSDYYSSNYLLDYRQLLSDYEAVEDGKINPWTIGQVNDDVIDMTRLMFSFIMDDYNLPDEIRYHVARLQIAYLKLGLDDKYLFLSKEHPARQLLMDITQSVNLWDQQNGGMEDLLEKIIATIDELIASYGHDSSVIEALGLDFRAFLSGDTAEDDGMRSHKRKEKTKSSKADNAKLHVEATLADICKGNRIPPIIEKILENYWSNLLFLEYLKDGEDAEQYQAFLKTSEMLVDSVQPKFTEEERKAMAKQLPVIVKRLKEGMNEIGVVSFESVDLFRELQQCHMEVLKEHPEKMPVQEFEVDEEEYADFREDQENTFAWDREAIEASMLEDNIERSISLANTDPSAFDDNPNIIRRSDRTDTSDPAVSRADRERQIIDDELKEARDAYELALKEHQDKKSKESGNTPEEDDFMAMFFNDPDFEKKQLSSKAKETEESEEENEFQIMDDPEIIDDFDDKAEMDVYTNEIDLTDLADLDDSDDELFTRDYSDLGTTEDPVDDASETDEPAAAVSIESDKPKPKPESKPEQAEPEKDPAKESLQKRAQGALEDDVEHLDNAVVEELIERLKVGIWVDLVHADGHKERAKIMAIVPTVGKYIFGDRRGRKIADFNRNSLYEAIQQGRIRLDDIDTAYDKTLESVIANLRVMKKAEDD